LLTVFARRQEASGVVQPVPLLPIIGNKPGRRPVKLGYFFPFRHSGGMILVIETPTYSNPTSRITIEAEVPDAKTAFETVAEVQELFDEKTCEACGSTNIRCDVRTAQPDYSSAAAITATGGGGA
jgi:hypothetical protein